MLGVSSCASVSAAGPSARALANQTSIKIVQLDAATAAQVRTSLPQASLTTLQAGSGFRERVGVGEHLEVTLWEAAPAVLFAGVADGPGGAGGKAVTLPAQVVGLDGAITVPFAGRIKASDRTPRDIEASILAGLAGKANRPQVLVRTTTSLTQEVTVVGQVANSVRMPLTPKGEKLLDAVAAAGGTKDPIDKVTVQVSRGSSSVSVPLERVIRDPRENIALAPSDVVTVYHQPRQFIAMGAVTKVGDVPFEGTGLNLAQALARAGGAADARANASGVFIARTEAGQPVVYRLNLKDPASLFAMREFPMQDGDILYVATSPAAELQKFLSLLGSAVYPLDAVRNLGN